MGWISVNSESLRNRAIAGGVNRTALQSDDEHIFRLFPTRYGDLAEPHRTLRMLL